ncbi:MAG TPA: hypothetical protein DCW65_11045, partial [Klebsiella pneumoniae]|nr:hypothetical protein [Klebsiella pneumoniae]
MKTSIPASSSSSTSCQRFGWREPGALLCASSSTRISAALARRPGLILVDELEHSNAPGSPHPKR